VSADQAWNIAEYRQSERHHREAIEAAVEQTRHSSDPELDSLLRRILHQTEKGDNTATKNPAPSALAPHDNDLPKSGKKKPGHSQAGEALPAAGAGLPATDATRTRFQDEVIEGGDGPPGRESGCRNGAIDCGG
jgi:hypothetical protein